jgi:hypothetical protein
LKSLSGGVSSRVTLALARAFVEAVAAGDLETAEELLDPEG